MNAVISARRAGPITALCLLAGACASGRPNTGLNDDRLVQRYQADINLVVEAAELALEGTELRVLEVRQQRPGMWQIVAETEWFAVEQVRILCAEQSDGRVEVRILNQRMWSRAYRRGWPARLFDRISNELSRMGVSGAGA